MALRSSSWNGPADGTPTPSSTQAGDAGTPEATDAPVRSVNTRSTSAFVIRPSRPVPGISARATPATAAIRRPIGVAAISSDTCAAASGAASTGGGASGTGAATAIGTAGAMSTTRPGSLAVGGDADVAASPAGTSAISASSVPASSPSTPAATRIARSTPATGASSSTLVLSVSTSTIGSPASTRSPSCFNQRLSRTDVTESASRGSRNSVVALMAAED